jgi:hypothetical protein
MRAVLLLALFATPAIAATPPASPGKPACQNPTATLVDGKAPRAGVHPLGHEPAAKQVLTVMRSVDGCVKPVVVRERIGRPRSQ